MTSSSQPYPGLRPFRKDEHAFFFGRYEHVAALYRLLDRGRLLAILGGSGSGKSSLTLAGLLPLLDAETNADGTPRWSIVAMRPGAHPIRRLATALLETAAQEGESVQRAIAGLRRTSGGLGTEVKRLLPAGSDVLILVDQFEELFRFAEAADRDDTGQHGSAVARLSRDDESRRFIDLLLSASRFSERHIRVVITMRSDFLGDCARFRGLAEAVSANQYLAPWLDRDQQREAIVAPLLRAAGRLDAGVFELADVTVSDWSDLIEPQLVEQLLNDAGDEPDQLPVLQHALRRCWRDADGRLTLQRYRDLGGWGVILSNHADQVMQRCGEACAATVERTFRALIETDGAGRAVRRPSPIARLVAETGELEADIRKVVAEFSSSDCSFLAPPTQPPDELIDIGHEALIRQWRKIAHPARGWLYLEAHDRMQWQLLMFQAQTYADNPTDLLSPTVVKQRLPWLKQRNEHWANRYGGQWPQVDRLMRDSKRASDAARRKKSALKSLAGILFAAMLLALGLVWQINDEKVEAQAVSIGLQLEFPDGAVEAGDKRALLELANDESGKTRLAFITQVSRSPELAGRLARNDSMVIRALVGVDRERRQQTIDHVFGRRAIVPENGTALYARAMLGAKLATEQAGESIVDALQKSTNPLGVRQLARVFAALPVALADQYRAAAIATIIKAVAGYSDARQLALLLEGLALLPKAKLTAEHAETVVSTFVTATRKVSNPGDLGLLGNAIAALAPALPRQQGERATETVLAAMQESDHSVALRGLAKSLARLPLKPEAVLRANQAVTPFLKAMRNTTGMQTMLGFATGLAALPASLTLTDAQYAEATRLIREAVPKPPRSYDLKHFAKALAALPGELSPQLAAQAAEPILATMARTTGPFPMKRLAQGVAALLPWLDEQQAVRAVTHVVNALQDESKQFYDLDPVAEGLVALTSALNEEQAEKAGRPIVDAMLSTPDAHTLGLLAKSVGGLSMTLSPTQTTQAVEAIFTALRKTSAPGVLRALRDGLAALAPRLNVEQSRRAVKPVLAAIWEASDAQRLQQLATGLAALTENLQGTQAVQPLIDAMKIPWTAGAASNVLVKALLKRLSQGGSDQPSEPNIWHIIAQLEQQFGDTIDLTSGPGFSR